MEALPALPIEPAPVPEALQAQVALTSERSACLVAVTEASLRALAPVRAAAVAAREGAVSLGQQERMTDVLDQVTTLEKSLGVKDQQQPGGIEAEGWSGAVEALADALRAGAEWMQALVAAQPASAPARRVGEATEGFLRRHLTALEAHTALELD